MTESGQLQPEETLDDRGLDDALDEGYSPPEKLRGSTAKGVTPREQAEGESIDERLSQEVPDDPVDAETEAEFDPPRDGEVGDRRAGRIVAEDVVGDEGGPERIGQDLAARDVGIDGGAASAEEAAVHLTEEPRTDVESGDDEEER